MAETHDPQRDDLVTGDPAAGAPRPSRTGSVSKLGFDDPTLRPLPSDRLEYHAPHTDAHPERHEHSDVPIRPLAISLAAIAFTVAGTFVFLYFLFFHYKNQQEALELKRTNVPAARPVIEGPRLQGVPGFSDKHPKEDLKDLRGAYRAELESYGKTRDGFAQVPVDRAMQLAIERGLFKTSQQNQGGQGQAQPTPGAESQAGGAQQGRAQPRPGTTQPNKQGTGAGGAAPPPRSPQREGGVR